MSLKKKILTFAAPLALLTLSACVTGLPTRVSRFQAMPAPQGQSFYVEAADADDRGGLEFEQYARLVRQHLAGQGYSEARSRGDATLIVSLDYGVDQGSQRVVAYADPFHDPWGGWSGRYRGFGYRPYYSRFGGYRGRSRYPFFWAGTTRSGAAATTSRAIRSTPRSSSSTSSARRTGSRCSKAPPKRDRAPTSCRPWCPTSSRRCSPASPAIRARP